MNDFELSLTQMFKDEVKATSLNITFRRRVLREKETQAHSSTTSQLCWFTSLGWMRLHAGDSVSVRPSISLDNRGKRLPVTHRPSSPERRNSEDRIRDARQSLGSRIALNPGVDWL